MKDHVFQEVCRIRGQQAAKVNFDPKAMMEDARRRQHESGHPVVSFAKKPKRAAA